MGDLEANSGRPQSSKADTTDPKKYRHGRSVETSGLSGTGDEAIIADIDRLIHTAALGEPYARNLLERIRLKLDDYLEGEPADGQ